MPLDLTELLEPIPGHSPGGEYLRYEPIYDQIRQARTEELDLPTGAWERDRKTADHALVIRLGRDLIATRSKDLQIAAWLTEALLKKEGLGGLAEGADLIRGMLEKFWDHLHPEIEDDDLEMRVAPLLWVANYLGPAVRTQPVVQAGYDASIYRESRQVGYEAEAAASYEKRDQRKAAIDSGKLTAEEFDAAIAETPKSWYRQQLAGADRAVAALAALGAVCDERFRYDAPNFSPVLAAIDDVRPVLEEILAKKLEKDPAPVEPELPVEVVIADEAPVAGPAGAGAPAPSAAAPLPTGRAGAEASIAAAARFLRAEAPANPAPYLMLRGLRWGELRADGGSVNPALLAAPPTEVRTRVRGLLLAGKWSELLDASEEVMATVYGRGWLDLQRYVVTATDALDGAYAAVGTAVRGALRSLLADLPDLPAMALADDTPTANAETRAWLRAEGLLPAGGGEPEEVVVPTRRSRGGDPLARARELAAAGKRAEAVELLMGEAEQERSARGRFLRRTQAAEVLVEASMPAVALPILEELSNTIDQHKLEEWEDAETIAQTLGLLYRSYVAVGESGSSVNQLYVRICRLDPLQAMKFGPQS